jgi:hypothetical protein
MRNLSVVAILLGISVACSNQPAAPVPPPTGTEPKAAAGVPASPTASTAPHPFTQSPWSPGAQTPDMWGRDPVAGTNEEIPRQRQ